MPTPTDNGTTYTFKIRDGVKWHDGSPLTAEDVAASWENIIHPPPGYNSARANWYQMVDSISVPDPHTVVFHLKFATLTFLPALADPYAYIYKKDILAKDPHWYEKNIMGSGPFKFASLRPRPVDQGRAQSRLLPQAASPTSTASSASSPTSRWCAPRRSAPIARRPNSAGCHPRRSISSRRSSATRSPSRRATGTAAI